MLAVALFAGVFNALNSGAVAWIKFHHHAVVPVWGSGGVMVNTLPSSIIPTLFMVFLGTHAARRRLSGFFAPRHRAIIRYLPANFFAFAGVLSIFTALAVAVITYLGVSIARTDVISFSSVMVTQLVQAFVMGAVLGPIIVANALRCAPQP